MLSKTSKLTAAFLVALVGAGVSSAPRLASADSTSTAILAGLAGLVVGHQYYYDTGGRRNYVSDSWAQSYYQKKDPSYFNSHRGTFQQDHGAFANKWNQDHAHGGGHSGNHGH
jgi:hypothetical protein